MDLRKPPDLEVDRGAALADPDKARLSHNPHLRYGRTGVNGYALVSLEQKAASVAFRTVRTVKEVASPVATSARFVVEAGRPGVQRA